MFGAFLRSTRRVWSEVLACAILIAILAAATAFAQGTLERVPADDANQNSPGLRTPNSNLMAQVGEMEVLSGPVSFHTRNYVSFGVLAHIRQNWLRMLSEKGLVPTSEQKAFTLEFTILKDGTLDSRRVAESSGDPELDRTGLDAIAKSAPFMAVPAEFEGDFLKLQCHFYLNPGRKIRSLTRAGLENERSDIISHRSAAAEGAIHGTEGTIHGNGATRPRAIYSPPPPYTEQARKAKIDGTVQLKVTVAANGDVDDVRIVKGLDRGLDEQAVETVRTWKFNPGTMDGTPVKSDIDVLVSFHLF